MIYPLSSLSARPAPQRGDYKERPVICAGVKPEEDRVWIIATSHIGSDPCLKLTPQEQKRLCLVDEPLIRRPDDTYILLSGLHSMLWRSGMDVMPIPAKYRRQMGGENRGLEGCSHGHLDGRRMLEVIDALEQHLQVVGFTAQVRPQSQGRNEPPVRIPTDVTLAELQNHGLFAAPPAPPVASNRGVVHRKSGLRK